jgi:DNA polymerase I
MTLTSSITAYIDGSQLLYRAEFGFPSRIVNRAGDDITGTFGFLALMRKALHDSPRRPTHCLVVFDADAPVPRSLRDDRYRATRSSVPAGSADNPFRHLTWIKQSLEAWGIGHIEHESAEADDVIATCIDRRSPGDHSVVISRDKDFHQVVDDTVTQWDTARGREKGWITPETVLARYGIPPSRWCDYVALVGDRSDEMPGIRGIGPVTARRLLRDGRSLEDIGRELSPKDLRDAMKQRGIHLLDRGIDISPPEPSPIPEEELIPAASVLETLGVWDSPYP